MALCLLFTSILLPVFAYDQGGTQVITPDQAANTQRLQTACQGKTSSECTAIANQMNDTAAFTDGATIDQNTVDKISQQAELATQASQQTKIDLYAPFSSKGVDIRCKIPASPKQQGNVKPGDGNYIYEEYSAGCEAKGGAMVQRLIINDRSSQGILSAYLGLIFRFALGVGVGASVLMVVFGGIKMITAFGNSNAQGDAKNFVIQGAAGLAILVLAVTILHIINPNFFQF